MEPINQNIQRTVATLYLYAVDTPVVVVDNHHEDNRLTKTVIPRMLLLLRADGHIGAPDVLVEYDKTTIEKDIFALTMDAFNNTYNFNITDIEKLNITRFATTKIPGNSELPTESHAYYLMVPYDRLLECFDKINTNRKLLDDIAGANLAHIYTYGSGKLVAGFATLINQKWAVSGQADTAVLTNKAIQDSYIKHIDSLVDSENNISDVEVIS